MASLLALCMAGIFIPTISTAAQLTNGTLQVSNVTVAETKVNLTSKPELPPGGLPEVIVNVAEVMPSNTTALPPGNVKNLQVEPMDGKGDEVTKIIRFDPDTVTKKVLGSRCKNHTECLSVNNTNCISNMCDCISGFIPSKHSLERCVKVPTGLGDDCEEEAQCAHVVPASECMFGKCSCPPNFVFDLSRCWEKQLLGGTCNTSVQCDSVAFSLCAQGVCACQTPLIPSPNSNKCLLAAGTVYRALCEEDIQCTESYGDEAHCSNSQCICTNNYHFNSTTCVPDKRLGDVCLSDVDCAVSDVNHVEGSRACINEICSCADGFISLQGEEICTEKSSAEELAVSFSWISCIIIAKYYLS